MIKKLYFLTFALAAFIFVGCNESDNDDAISVKDGPKPTMEITASPIEGASYGDKISVTGLVTDKRNLDHYDMILLNGNGDTLSRKTQALLGQTFHVSDALQIPLPKNASVDNMKLIFKLDNTRNGEEIKTFDISNVALPVFGTLHLCLGNGQIVDLIKNGDVYETSNEVLFPAGVKGIISTKTGKSGIWWGTKDGEIASMAKDSITIGKDIESSYTVSFNPVTFEITFGTQHIWSPITGARTYYLIGTISGDWRDGEITAEKPKMMMTGYQSGDDKYYTWTAPEGDDINTGMSGTTAAGVFRLKLAGLRSFILWDGTNIVQSTTDDKDKSFPLTKAGPFTIKVNFHGDVCSSVEVTGSGRSVTFANGKVITNGYSLATTAAFAGTQLPLKSGSSYIYEGIVKLNKGQSASSDFDLSNFTTNPDLFSGQGNSSWSLKTVSGDYLVRLDAFSGNFYACPTSGYPDFIYFDGWSWGPNATSTPISWDNTQLLPLVNNGNGVYEATLYDFGWGGNFRLYTNYMGGGGTSINIGSGNFNSTYIDAAYNDVFLLPSSEGAYKIIVDLKSGLNISNGVATPKGTEKFTLEFKAQ